MTTASVKNNEDVGFSPVGVAATVLLVLLSVAGWMAGFEKLFVISWVAFVAMAGFAIVGAREIDRDTGTRDAYRLVWGYGLAAGAMVTSAAVFLLPQAFGLSPKIGGFGVAAGIVVGYAGHTVGHRLAHLGGGFDSAAAQLAAHSLSAGLIIGVIYASLPELGLLLGLAIVSHKGPAGYAAARRLRRAGRPVSVLLLPAAGVGLAGLPVAFVKPAWGADVNAAVFGFAAGVFLHVAMDFLPECEVGGEVGEVADIEAGAHELLDRLRVHAVAATVGGGVAVLLGWLLLQA